MEKELLEVLKKNYGQCEVENVNGNIFVNFEECKHLYNIINCVDNNIEYKHLVFILNNICDKYNYDFVIKNNYTILVYKL